MKTIENVTITGKNENGALSVIVPQGMSGKQLAKWKKAHQKEIDAINSDNTDKEVDLPSPIIEKDGKFYKRLENGNFIEVCENGLTATEHAECAVYYSNFNTKKDYINSHINNVSNNILRARHQFYANRLSSNELTNI